MKFNDYLSGYDGMYAAQGLAKRYGIPKQTPAAFYESFEQLLMASMLGGEHAAICRMADGSISMAPLRQCRIEQRWYELLRPYYNVWPGIIDPLAKVNLDTVTCDQIHLPMPCIAFRLPAQSNRFQLDDGRILKALLVSDMEKDVVHNAHREFTLWMDFAEEIDGMPIWTYRRFLMRPEWSIGQAMYDMGSAEPVPHTKGVARLDPAVCNRIVSLVCGCLLLDSDFVVPDVLNRDKTKPLTEERIERAHKNGKVGWDIGRELDVNPHWRRPHPALMWTGKGRTVAKITMRKGAIVRRSTIGQIPTGFIDKELHNESGV